MEESSEDQKETPQKDGSGDTGGQADVTTDVIKEGTRTEESSAEKECKMETAEEKVEAEEEDILFNEVSFISW